MGAVDPPWGTPVRCRGPPFFWVFRVVSRVDELRAQREALFEARRAYAKTPDKTPDIRMETPDMWETPDKPRTRVESTQDVVGVCGCGTPLVRGMRGPVPRYCSDACRKREARKRG